MYRFERVTAENIREDDFLLANPDAAQAIKRKHFKDATDFLLSQKGQTRYQYTKNEKQSKTSIVNGTFSGGGGLLQLIDAPMESLSEQLGEKYADIYSPVGFLTKERVGLTSNFMENSTQYHKDYFNIQRVKSLLQTAFDAADVEYHNPTILDLGCGSGNFTFACCELFKTCHVLATDLSYELLSILNCIKKEHYPEAHIELAAMDALDIRLKESSFDLFIGSAILHHLINFEQVFYIAHSSLKERGYAIFGEPMMSGYLMLLSLLKTLLIMNKSHMLKIKRKIVNMFNRMIIDLTVRGCVHEKMVYGARITDLDDKWMFTRDDIESAAKAAGFEEVQIINVNKPPRFQSQITELLRYIEEDYKSLPAWSREIIEVFDESDLYSNKNDILFYVMIICKK